MKTVLIITSIALAVIFVGFSLPGHAQVSDTPPPPKGVAPNASTQETVLNGFSTTDLRDFLARRRNKSIDNSIPSPLNDISSEAITDNIIYREKSIYGTDRRKDFYEIRDIKQMAAANSVAILVKSDHYKEEASTLEVFGRRLGEELGLCSDQQYFAQPVVGYCTSFVIGPDTIATAGHCVPAKEEMANVRIVFGFREQSNGAVIGLSQTIFKEDVYIPTTVVARAQEPNGADYAVIKVDRPITNHAPLVLSVDKDIAVGDEVYVIGFPSGLPMKLADNAFVRSVSTRGYFVSNLDVFGGNSGSPVFIAGSETVAGILVRGGTDYVAKDKCNVAYVCPSGFSGCQGEDSTSAKLLAGKVPKAVAESVQKPITKTFSSGPVPSGPMKSFSRLYEVRSDTPPPGFKISDFSGVLNGDRACNSWSTCAVTKEGDHAVFRFSLQGHDEWPFPGQALSTGTLIVTYSPE
ncbi:trypsin-like serine peptidase [Caballeronia sp. KNU42]